MKTYLYSYSYNGARYALEIVADNASEAEQRLRAIKFGHVNYDGTLEARISAELPGSGALTRSFVWLKNLLRRERVKP